MEIIGKYNTAEIFTENIDEESITQIYTMLNNPAFENGKIAIMPDVHVGKGSVVGFTMELNRYISPMVIGVDIGCGIDGYNLGKIDINLEEFDNFVRKYVPHGRGTTTTISKKIKIYSELETLINKIDKSKFSRVMQSIGSLGGGNHFIELEVDSEGNKWLLIHSGSRNLGLMTAKYHQDRAKEFMKEMFSGAGAYYGLEFLDVEKSGREYIEDMKLVQAYAVLNRSEIARKIIEEFLKLNFNKLDKISSIHNYINFEDNIVRKGAISAKKGEMVIIPMNMRDGSLIARGKGNSKWNLSAPHGAGRIMRRGEAKEKISLDEFKNSMNGIYSTSVSQGTIDESPMAYKPMEEIKSLIGDTVEILETMKPIYNFKADE